MSNAKQLILEAIEHQDQPRAKWTAELAADLLALSDGDPIPMNGGVENGELLEFYGRDAKWVVTLTHVPPGACVHCGAIDGFDSAALQAAIADTLERTLQILIEQGGEIEAPGAGVVVATERDVRGDVVSNLVMHQPRPRKALYTAQVRAMHANAAANIAAVVLATIRSK